MTSHVHVDVDELSLGELNSDSMMNPSSPHDCDMVNNALAVKDVGGVNYLSPNEFLTIYEANVTDPKQVMSVSMIMLWLLLKWMYI